MLIVKKSETYIFDKEEELKNVILANQKEGYLVENMTPMVLREIDGKLQCTVAYRHGGHLEIIRDQ